MKFSKQTGCFYPDDIAYAELPSDVIDVPQEDFDAAMARNPGDTLDVIAGRVVVVLKPAPSQALLRTQAWESIKTKRDQLVLQGVKVGTKWYHSDEASRTKYIELLRMADAAVAAGGAGTTTLQHSGQDIQWKTMDGTFIKMTVQLANDVFAAVSGLDFAAFAVAETHKVAMEGASDPAAYDFSAGWPETFGG